MRFIRVEVQYYLTSFYFYFFKYKKNWFRALKNYVLFQLINGTT